MVAVGFYPLAAIGSAFVREQHVEQGFGACRVVVGEADEAARVRIHRGFAQLRRVHFAEAFEAGDVDFAVVAVAADSGDGRVTFGFVQRVFDAFAGVNAVERRHGDVEVSRFDQCWEVPHHQGADEGGDVQAVRVGVGEDADFAVAQAAQVVAGRVNADGNGDVVDFL